MNSRDLDRRLRDWLEPGAERAREAIVWQVIDQVEHISQRPRWRARLAPLLDSVLPLARPIAVAALLLLAVVALALLATRNVGQPHATARPFTSQDLDAILVWDDTKPSTWHLDNLISNPTEVLLIPARSMSDSAWTAQPAFRTYVGGRYTDFTGQDAVFMSWGAVFSSVGGARDAFAVVARELGADPGWGLGAGQAIQLGDGGVVLTGDTTALVRDPESDPAPARIYLWSRGNILLAVGGWFSYDEAELESVAEAMDARARLAEARR